MNAGGPVDDYLNAVRGAMRGMDPRVREDILRELRSHVAEAASANGGDVPRAVAALGPASQVGRAYRAVYGYGRGYQILFIVVAALLSALTVPVLGGAPPSAGTVAYAPNLASFPFLVLVVLWLLWVSVAAGSRAGLYAGLGAFAGRIAMAAALVLTPSGGILTADGVALLVLSSALLVLLGLLPGTAKKAWSKPGADL
ncbi:MAG TPA: hypothetical protein HA326_06720 [Thermoplasmata archaeon]|nr:hypothetical protein [Thermoplasmata archaeon]